MNSEELSIGYMCKVGVLLEPCNRDKQAVSQPMPVSFEFILGIGPKGISPFEKLIFGKYAEEVLFLPTTMDLKDQVFKHLTCSAGNSQALFNHPYLKITIQTIRKAENREVIKAMAAATEGCGDGCECGCGCGH